MPDGIVMANGETRDVGGVQIEATAAYDIKPGEPFHPKGEANGYIVTIGAKRIYVVGVTECVPESARRQEHRRRVLRDQRAARAHGAGRGD